MPVFEYQSRFEFACDEVFDWHARPGALERLTPPWHDVRVLERTGGIRDGGRVLLRVGGLRWEAVHRDYREGHQFRDEQVSGPFARWVHTHSFLPEGPSACELQDRVEYHLPGGALADAVGAPLVERALRRSFRFRHERLRRDLERHAALRGAAPLRVAISGASGLVGSQLSAFLTSGGHRVDRLVRSPPAPGTRDVFWDPATERLEPEALEGVDAVIHLAGESVGSGRWTEARKRRILESRTRGTRLLASVLARLSHPPRLLVSASAVGYYGDRGDEWLEETSEPGAGFLADVARQWEAAAEPAREAGIRVVVLRIGVVLSLRGGALARLLPPFRLGAGGPVGSGRQYLSWIALDDLVGVVHHLLGESDASGPLNAVAPEPVTSAEFARTLGRVLRRPALLRLPAGLVRLALGELAEELLLSGQRVSATRLRESGFRFLFPDLESALRSELGRLPRPS